MLWTISVILLSLWLLGISTPSTLHGYIHVLLGLAVLTSSSSFSSPQKAACGLSKAAWLAPSRVFCRFTSAPASIYFCQPYSAWRLYRTTYFRVEVCMMDLRTWMA